MIDNTKKPIEGHFILETYENGKLVDIFEDKNMIMKNSKLSVRNAMAGDSTGTISPTEYEGNIKIATFVMGDMGHVTDNLLIPKSFTYDRNDLFSFEDALGKTYPISFRDDGTGVIITDEGYDKRNWNPNNTPSTVQINKLTGTETEEIQYIFEIPETTAVPSTEVSVFTEAALYTNFDMNVIDIGGANPTINSYGTIFAMRTFPAKVKTPQTAFRIIWKIIF